jgi:hypothetical protein
MARPEILAHCSWRAPRWRRQPALRFRLKVICHAWYLCLGDALDSPLYLA